MYFRSGRSRKPVEPVADSGTAQKKFGGAKAISSDQYFADDNDMNVSNVALVYMPYEALQTVTVV